MNRWDRLTNLWLRMYALRDARRAEVGWAVEVGVPIPVHDLELARMLSRRMDAVNVAAVAAQVGS